MGLLQASFLCASLMVFGLTGHSLNELKSVSYSNHSAPSDDAQALELGSITLSFAEKPFIVAHSIKQSSLNGSIELFCPHSFLGVNKIPKDISFSERASSCSIKLECVKEPLEGVKLVINYDPQKVHVSYDEYIDLGSAVSFVVRLYDQRILSKLHNHTVQMLRLA